MHGVKERPFAFPSVLCSGFDKNRFMNLNERESLSPDVRDTAQASPRRLERRVHVNIWILFRSTAVLSDRATARPKAQSVGPLDSTTKQSLSLMSHGLAEIRIWPRVVYLHIQGLQCGVCTTRRPRIWIEPLLKMLFPKIRASQLERVLHTRWAMSRLQQPLLVFFSLLVQNNSVAP